MKAYHATLLRYVHDASSEEFANIGVFMWLPDDKTSMFEMTTRYGRVSEFFGEAFDGDAYRTLVDNLERVLRVRHGELLHGDLYRDIDDVDAAKGYLLRDDSTCFQWSRVFCGAHPNPEQRFRELLHEFVYRFDQSGKRDRRDDKDVARDVDRHLRDSGLAARVEHNRLIRTELAEYRFQAAWRNGKLQVLEPISLDYSNATDVDKKALLWNGRLHGLSQADFSFNAVVALPQDEKLSRAGQRALKVLKSCELVRNVVTEDRISDLFAQIEQDLASEASEQHH